MNPLWILAAFLFGAIISRIGLPLLVGYLLAGFALNSFGVTGGEPLESVADAGVGFADHVCEHMDYCRLKNAEL